VDEGKVRGVERVVQVVEIVVDLNRRKLAFVDDVGGGEGADVKVLGESDLVSGMLSKDI
jgi:hypothetical protein